MKKRVKRVKKWALIYLLLLFSFGGYAQMVSVSGVVLDREKIPLPGVNVTVKGTMTGVVTDRNGKYAVTVPGREAVLVFSFVGYATQEVTVGDRTDISLTMEEAATEIEEVVVIGYGTVKKSDLTGSVVSVKASDLNVLPTTSFAEMLRGKAPGVLITTSSGAPGSGAGVLIRGKNSISGGNSPLYVVDGIFVENISDLNTSDIASLEILKDASAQAIFGARAANGVFLISTKRGESGKISVDFNTYFGKQFLQRNFDFYSGDEWSQLRNEARRTDNKGEYLTDYFVDDIMTDVYKSKKYIDWEDLMFDPAWVQKHDLSIRAGSEKTKIAFGMGYFNQDGMVQKSGYERGTFRLNIDQQLHKNLNIGANFAYTRSKRQITDGSFNSFITVTPLAKPYDDEGNVQKYVTSSNDINPLWNIQQYDAETRVDRFLMSAFMEWNIIDGLKYRLSANINMRNSEAGTYQSSLHTSASGSKGHGTLSNSSDYEYLIDNILTYGKTFGVHDVEMVLVQSVNRDRSKSIGTTAEQFPSDLFKWNAIPDAELILKPSRGITQRSLASFVGRLRYGLLDRYLLTASIRSDGSSVFGKENKWGFFPSVAVAWKINNESFLKDADWLTALKLRLSYGQVGNQAVSAYKTLGLVSSYQMLFGDGSMETGYLPSSELQNPRLKWETTTSTNVGLDFGFLNNRVSGTLEYYVKNTSNLLIDRSLNTALGYEKITTNIGKVQNKGIEVLLSGDVIRNRELRWTLDFTFSANRNKIVALDGRTDENGKPVDDVDNRWFIGQPIDVYYDYSFNGIWQLDDDIAGSHMPAAKPGAIKLTDVSGPDGVPDGKISDADRVIYHRDPKWFGSLTSSLKWKQLDLMLDFYTLYGGVKRNTYLYDSNAGGSLQGKRNGIKVNYWTPENPSNEFPRPSHDSNASYFGTAAFQKMTYFRLRAATIGFSFPEKWIAKVKLSNARIYCTGANLWTKTDYLSYGPELETGDYPEASSVIIGLNISF
ncbi:MAG: TonB-dependent receptor [Bacteroidales bacterium]|jgi:TonB-linked SusC/RagA family outer membrane protein|nr:TonB-dependent receptor [Bacteroidales bacterium]